MSQYLEDGYQTLITLSVGGSIKMLEKSVTPPGIHGGDQIELTTMRNALWRTFAPQWLMTLQEFSLTVAYDPVILTTLASTVLNVNQLITVTHSDGSSWEFWAYVKSLVPNENTIGDQPTGVLTIVPTNRNDNRVETAPVYNAAV